MIKSTQKLPIIYAITLVTLVIWILSSYIINSNLIDHQSEYSTLINTSGKQRMLSQRSTLLATLYIQKHDKYYLTELTHTIDMMRQDHQLLLNHVPDSIKSIYLDAPYQLDQEVQQFLSLLTDFTRTPSTTAQTVVAEFSDRLLPKLDYAVSRYETQSNTTIQQIEKTELLILTGALVTLLFEAVIIFLPFFRRIVRNEQTNANLASKYQGLLDFSSDCIHLIDENGNLVDCSHNFCEMLGYSKQQLIGKPISYWEPTFDPKTLTKVSKALLNTPTKRILTQFQTADGVFLDVDLLVQRVIIEGQALFQVSARDVTEFNILRSRLELALEANDIGYWEFDLVTTNVTYAGAAAKLLGFTPNERGITTDTWEDILHPDDKAKTEQLFNQLVNGEIDRYTIVHRVKHKDGDYRWLQVKAYRARQNSQGQSQLIIGVFTDISQQIENEKLLEDARIAAEQANLAKSEFLANMSHEIRTPLNGIIGLTELTLDTELNQLQRSYLTQARQSSEALLNVINDILDYSKIEAGKLEIITTPLNLEALLSRVASLFSAQISKKGLEFIFSAPYLANYWFKGDQLRLIQVLNNLVSNALKFTERGFIEINVNIHAESQDDGLTYAPRIDFMIKDSGIGIRPQYQGRIFQAFEQGDSSTTKKYGGTGLGLRISKQLANLMNGDIVFTSTEGEGSTFTLSLPLEQMYKNSSLLLSSDTSGTANEDIPSVVMVIGGHAQTVTALERVLRELHCELVPCETYKEAKQIITQQVPDVIVVNHEVDKFNGTDIVAQLTQLNRELNVVYMVDEYQFTMAKQRANQLGVRLDKLLMKPFTPSQIVKLINPENVADTQERNTIHSIKLLESKRLLIVEDNAINRLVASTLFENIGFDVSVAEDGKIAVEMCQRQSFDLILMDIQMPELDGYEATKIIRRFNNDVLIFALSASVLERDVTLSYESGMQEHLAKPIDRAEVYEVLGHYFEVRRVDAEH